MPAAPDVPAPTADWAAHPDLLRCVACGHAANADDDPFGQSFTSDDDGDGLPF